MAAVIDPSIKRINKTYATAIEEMLDYLVTSLAEEGLTVADYSLQSEVINRIGAIIKELKMHMEVAVSEEIEKVFLQSTKEFEKRMLEQGVTLTTFAGTQTTLSDRGKLQALISDTMTDLARATDKTELYVKQIIRDVFANNIGNLATQTYGREQITSEIYKMLAEKGLSKKVLEEGFIGLVDKSGKKWNLKTYVDTVVRTKLMDADIEANRSAGHINNVDLAVISQHGAKDDCAKWEGCIVSMNGMTEGFPLYADIKATNECFHPRCGHHLQPVRNIELIHDSTIKQSERKMKENWQTLKQV